jgi:uncharacterized membrane protein
MFYGFRYHSGLWLLVPVVFALFFFGHAFRIVIPPLFLGLCLLPRYGFFRSRRCRSPLVVCPRFRHLASENLRQRYACGEIDAVTYEQMRERLESPEEPLGQ